jgi:Glucodextranase, domain B
VVALRLLSPTIAMRNLLTLSTGLLLLATTAACDSGPGAVKEPPVLKVTSPARSMIQDHAGPVMVSGTVTPNANGDAVTQVLVNGVRATVGADGTFAAMIDVQAGATLIETVAHDAAGTTITDSRAVQAGQLRPVGTNIPGAIAIAMSSDAFTKISAAAGPILKGLDLSAMLAPLQPMVSAGTTCNGIRLSVDNVKFSDVKIALSPVAGGLAFSAELDGIDVSGHANYGLLCVPETTSLRVQATKVVVAGTLDVSPSGMTGFTTKLNNPDVAITGLDVSASGVPGTLLGLLDFNSVIGLVAGKAAELAMNPLMNQALGALGGPQTLDLFGKQLTMQMAPSAIAFEAGGASLTMSLKVLLGGSEHSPGFIFTDNGTPSINPTQGFQLGIADDLANEMLAELAQIGMLDLKVPAEGGTFEEAQIQMNLPPMISADAGDGQMRLVLGDMYATFLHHGAPVGKAAINAKVDLKIAPASNGYGVALQLGIPEIHVDPLDDVANTTGLEPESLGRAVAACLGSQIDAITKLLVAIPLPQIAGLQVRNLSIGSDAGYVMIHGQFD